MCIIENFAVSGIAPVILLHILYRFQSEKVRSGMPISCSRAGWLGCLLRVGAHIDYRSLTISRWRCFCICSLFASYHGSRVALSAVLWWIWSWCVGRIWLGVGQRHWRSFQCDQPRDLALNHNANRIARRYSTSLDLIGWSFSKLKFNEWIKYISFVYKSFQDSGQIHLLEILCNSELLRSSNLEWWSLYPVHPGSRWDLLKIKGCISRYEL